MKAVTKKGIGRKSIAVIKYTSMDNVIRKVPDNASKMDGIGDLRQFSLPLGVIKKGFNYMNFLMIQVNKK